MINYTLWIKPTRGRAVLRYGRSPTQARIMGEWKFEPGTPDLEYLVTTTARIVILQNERAEQENKSWRLVVNTLAEDEVQKHEKGLEKFVERGHVEPGKPSQGQSKNGRVIKKSGGL